MPRYALDLEFNGAAFSGSQSQTNTRTLQDVVQTVLAGLDGQRVGFRPASRLDQGVSARALPGDCLLDRDWEPEVLGLALNQVLPADVVVRRVARVPDGFDARRNATAKRYRYRVLARPVRPTLDSDCLWVRRMNRAERLHELAALIPGLRDLSGFACLRKDGTDEQDPHREYLSAQWSEQAVDGAVEWTLRISGRGFLYKQIRGLVGAMVHVAQGRAGVDDFHTVMAAGWSARRLGNIAPAEGLQLVGVDYEPQPNWQWVGEDDRHGPDVRKSESPDVYGQPRPI